MGSTKNPEPVQTAKDNFHRQRLIYMVIEPRIQLLGLCSFDARRKSRFLVFGAEKRRFFGAREEKKKVAAKYFWGAEKVNWPPNTIITRRRRFFFKKSRGFSAWASKNIAP